MPNKKTLYELRPQGWPEPSSSSSSSDAEQEVVETWPLSTIDACPVCSWCQFVLPIPLGEDDAQAQRERVVAVLKQGLEQTLREVRFLCSHIDVGPEGDFSFVQRRDMTIPFQVQYFDSPDEDPSFQDLEDGYFAEPAFGRDPTKWGLRALQWGGARPEAQPEARPVACGFAADFVRGGVVLSLHLHHYATDVMGFSHLAHQLADNCNAIVRVQGPGEGQAPQFPGFDPANMDASRFTKVVPKDERIDGPLLPPPYPHPELASMLVHIPQSKAAQLKRLATTPAGEGRWISTYDAVSAFVWRHLTRVRMSHLYHAQVDPASTPYFGEAVDLRPRFHNPDMSSRFMRNAIAGGFSPSAPVTPLTVDEIASAEKPLSGVAAYIRALTDSVTQAHVEGLMGVIAPIRDKRSISLNLKSLGPLAVWITSHREADPSHYDFGFGRPKTHRLLWGGDLDNGLVIIYPAIATDRPDEGWSIGIVMEKELVPKLLEDAEWTNFAQCRSVELPTTVDAL